jgi:CMP-N,N'-diacetyllegionaminic acid synthase
MEIIGIIPARGGSKGVPRKNIYPLCGKPLIAYTIEAAKGSGYLTRTILTSDSEEIIRVALEYNLEAPFVRPKELARDDTPALAVITHAVNWLEENEGYRPDFIALLQPTSPLRNSKHIDEALGRLVKSDADCIVSVVSVPHNYNPYSVMRLEKGYLKPWLEYNELSNIRQQKPVFFARNGAAIYAFTYECLMKKKSLYGDKILPYEMGREASVDIDDMFDLRICEMLLRDKQNCDAKG